MTSFPASDIAAIQAISAVPMILDAVASMTGLGFVCIARVTGDSWTACAVRDGLAFGLGVGGQLDVTTTLCEQVRDSGNTVVIDNVSTDARYHDHHTPRIYGFQSYISVPIFRTTGEYFGTLCGLDPQPHTLSTPAVVNSLALFAQLISAQLASESTLAAAKEALLDEIETAELREQFIAVLGHDVRNPLGAILTGADLMLMMPETPPKTAAIAARIKRSAQRIAGLVDDVVDFTRGRMGGGIALNLQPNPYWADGLRQVVAELQSIHPEREIGVDIGGDVTLLCDGARLGQLLSNLLKNALVHGDPAHRVQVSAHCADGAFRLLVSNRGAPLAADTIDKLFKPYWRAAPAREQAHEGLGLGLFIVAEIARAHGGTVEVSSDEAGTAFIFSMPLA